MISRCRAGILLRHIEESITFDILKEIPRLLVRMLACLLHSGVINNPSKFKPTAMLFAQSMDFLSVQVEFSFSDNRSDINGYFFPSLFTRLSSQPFSRWSITKTVAEHRVEDY
jgi:hypothetical protein